MQDDRNPKQPVGSTQDGEDPNRRTDYLNERSRPGLHGGGGDPGWKADSRTGEKSEAQNEEGAGLPTEPAKD